MSKRSARPSPALVISIIALFVALGGTVYAAGKINGKAIKVKSLPGNRLKDDAVTGAQVKESTLGKVPNATHADSADNALTANTVGGHGASCPGGTAIFDGNCWEVAVSAKTSAPAAAEACTTRGGSLPTALQLRSFVKQSGLPIGTTNEWSSDIADVAALDEYTVVIVSSEAKLNLTASTDPHQYRCVIPLVR